jgi:hypothetical protein
LCLVLALFLPLALFLTRCGFLFFFGVWYGVRALSLRLFNAAVACLLLSGMTQLNLLLRGNRKILPMLYIAFVGILATVYMRFKVTQQRVSNHLRSRHRGPFFRLLLLAGCFVFISGLPARLTGCALKGSPKVTTDRPNQSGAAAV